MYIHSEASQLDSISLDYQKILGNYLKNAIQKVEDKNLDYLCSFSVSINHFPIKNLLNHQQFPLALKLYLNIPETQKDLEKESILALGKAADSLAPDQHCLKFFKQFSQGILTSHPLFLASLGFYGADKSLIWDQFNTEKPFFIPELMVYQKGPNNFLIFNLLIKKDFYFSPDFKDRVLNKWLFLLDWVCSAKSLNHKVPNTAQLENSNYLISKKSFKKFLHMSNSNGNIIKPIIFQLLKNHFKNRIITYGH